MTRPETKTAELLHATALVRLMPALGVVGEPEPREQPDFRLTLAGGRTVGLEHVRAVDRRIAAGNGAVEKINERRTRVIGYEGHKNGLSPQQADQIAELMDSIHKLPNLVSNWERCDESLLRGMRNHYDTRWNGELLQAYDDAVAASPQP